MYYRGLRNLRDVSLNSHFLVLFKTPRCQGSINTLAYQLFPGKSKGFLEIFRNATELPFSYLFIDCKSDTPNFIRLRSCLLPGESTVCYILK